MPPPGPHERTKESRTGLLGSAHGLLQSTPGRQAASAGTGMLFALRSMAIRMTPVLSSDVSHQHAEDQTVFGQAGHPELAHSPGSEWIAQQLQKAYHGLTATLTPGINAQLAEPDSRTSAQDVCEQQHLSAPEQQHQHAVQAVSDSQHAGHQCIGCESHLSQSPASHLESASQTQSVTSSKPETTAPGTESPAGASLLSARQDTPSHQKQVQQPQQVPQQQQQQSQQLDQQQQQHQQQQRSNDDEQPPAAGNEGTQAAVEADQLEGVPDRVPAVVALEQPDDSQQIPPENTVTLPEPSEAAPASSDAQTEIGQPQEEATEKQEQAQKNKSSPAPVFVPIVVAMDACDHKLLVEEWYSRQMAMSGQLTDKDVSDKDMTDSANATYSRIRLLQDHLCTYAERNVPVVSINFSNFSDTLDQLHDYLLQCIESAMAQQQ